MGAFSFLAVTSALLVLLWIGRVVHHSFLIIEFASTYNTSYYQPLHSCLWIHAGDLYNLKSSVCTYVGKQKCWKRKSPGRQAFVKWAPCRFMDSYKDAYLFFSHCTTLLLKRSLNSSQMALKEAFQTLVGEVVWINLLNHVLVLIVRKLSWQLKYCTDSQ